MVQAEVAPEGPRATASTDHTTPTATPQTLEDRYGTGRKRGFDRRFAWSAAVLLVAGGIAYLIFGGWQQTTPVDFQEIGYTVDSETETSLRFEVSAPPQESVACVVEALSPSKATVGWKTIELPDTTKRTHSVSTTILTTNTATTARVKDCWLLEE